MNWLYKLPIPQTKVALGIVLSVVLTVTYCICVFKGTEVPEGGLAIMATFIAGIFGIGAHEYKTKRTTDLDFVEAQGNAELRNGK